MTKELRIYNGERIISSINGDGKVGQLCTKGQSYFVLYHKQKIAQNIVRLVCKIRNYKICMRNIGSRLIYISFGDDSLGLTAKSKTTKAKINMSN